MKNRRLFIQWITTAALVATTLAVSCSNDDDDATLAFEVPSVYFDGPGAQVTVRFSAQGVDRFYITSRPTGWEEETVVLDADRQQITITMPEPTEDGTVASSGAISLNGYAGSSVKNATLFVGIIPQQPLAGPANSFLVNQPECSYSFALQRRDGTAVPAASVALIWQSTSKLIQYLHFDAGSNRVSFYVGADATYTEEIMRGNALIGAYDADDNLLWSWHIWSCGYDPEETCAEWQNGYRMMNRNLGALDSANETTEEKLASYGLYYQWGRKDPFIGPSDYKFSKGASASLYSTDYATTSINYVESSAETGTDAYAAQNPLDFVLGVEETQYDWQWSASTNDWSLLNDPCPAGWRVAPSPAFEGLAFDGAPTEDDFEAYGWTMTDGTAASLFPAGGRRTYLNGFFQNIYEPAISGRANTAEEAQPWVGYYWTADRGLQRDGVTFYFWYNKKEVTGGVAWIDQPRANAQSVRCVRE